MSTRRRSTTSRKKRTVSLRPQERTSEKVSHRKPNFETKSKNYPPREEKKYKTVFAKRKTKKTLSRSLRFPDTINRHIEQLAARMTLTR